MDDFLLIHAGWDGKQNGKRLLSRKLAVLYGQTGKQKIVDLLDSDVPQQAVTLSS